MSRLLEKRFVKCEGASAYAPIADVQDAFNNAPYCPLRSIRCEWDAGIMVVHGFVPSFYLKQVALCMARRYGGPGCVVDDRLEVK